MRVWLALEREQYEGDTVLGVGATAAAARRIVGRYNQEHYGGPEGLAWEVAEEARTGKWLARLPDPLFDHLTYVIEELEVEAEP